ncbi:MAG: hypothetical protein LBV26_00360, partial [Bacteroidales bacterium]|nr:hypothetical protein [Bacteroidales bacterium]
MPNTVNNIKYSAVADATPATGFGILASADATPTSAGHCEFPPQILWHNGVMTFGSCYICGCPHSLTGLCIVYFTC